MLLAINRDLGETSWTLLPQERASRITIYDTIVKVPSHLYIIILQSVEAHTKHNNKQKCTVQYEDYVTLIETLNLETKNGPKRINNATNRSKTD